MKYIKLLLILLLIPFIVLAEECDISKITITSMEQQNINGSAEEINEPTYQNRTINLDIKMYDVGDSITYNMTIKNDSKEDYMIDEDTFKTNSDYIEYTLKTNDNNNVVKANDSKDVSLIVTYKNKVDSSLLNNNKFDASNSLKLSLNTNSKEQELDVITTDNVKKIDNVSNPVTSISSMMLISFILLTTIIVSYILIKRKHKYTKYLIIFLSITLIPTVFAICKCDIEVESKIEIDNSEKLIERLYSLAETNPTCIKKYEGNVTDEVGKTTVAKKVFFDNCEETRNVIFGGFCWQIIRTTETDGTKMMYNGIPADGKCLNNRDGVNGITAITTWPSIESEYLYGSSYSFDITRAQFTLKDTFSSEYNKETIPNLINKYTCLSNGDTCSQLYLINGMYSEKSAYTAQLHIGGYPYSFIGLMPFNSDEENISSVGYMFNKQSTTTRMTIGTKMYKYANSFTYDKNTNTYTLTGDSQSITDITSSSQLNDTRYTCLNESGSCEVLRYILNASYSPNYVSEISFIDLTDGDGYAETINKEIKDDNINKYNSTIKMFIDDWYKDNLINYSKKLENTVYCNNRETSYNGFFEDNINKVINFKHYDLTNNIECNQLNNQFSVDNEKAKLKYPIALMTAEELKNVDYNLIKGGYYGYWTMTPGSFGGNNTYMYWVSSGDFYANNGTNRGYGVRPVISLKKNNILLSGTGTQEDPWILDN